MSNETNPLEKLRGDPNFRSFAEQKMTTNGDFWKRESAEGQGFMREVATAIVAIGGGGQHGST